MAERRDIQPSELPFPWPSGSDPMTAWESLGEFKSFLTALTAGTILMTAPKASLVLNGVLAFYQDQLTIFLYDGRQWSVGYETIASFRIKRGLPYRKLTLHGTDDATRIFRIGPELAANAKYVLSAKGVAHR
jgi:hypothetical protein